MTSDFQLDKIVVYYSAGFIRACFRALQCEVGPQGPVFTVTFRVDDLFLACCVDMFFNAVYSKSFEVRSSRFIMCFYYFVVCL